MRTNKSVKNIISIVIFNLLIGILGFAKVKVFVAGLSDDIYSLNQLFFQIFSYIAIADAGFGLILNFLSFTGLLVCLVINNCYKRNNYCNFEDE